MHSTECIQVRQVNLTAVNIYYIYLKLFEGLRAITAPNYRQANKLSQLRNTQLNSLKVTFLGIYKWREINLKKGERLTITAGSLTKAD